MTTNPGSVPEMSAPAFKWYVYELIDPRDGLTFYVGKGSGNRIAEHERDALCVAGVCSEKLSKIKEVWASGAKVRRQHVAWFKDEQAAYDHEAERVSQYGLAALTNVVPGGGFARIKCARRREIVQWSPMQAAKSLVLNKSVLHLFARWLVAADTGKPVEVSGSAVAISVTGVAMKTLFPSVWRLLRQSRDAIDLIAPHLRSVGVELQIGRA